MEERGRGEVERGRRKEGRRMKGRGGEKRKEGIGGEGTERKYKVGTRSLFYRLEFKRVRTKQFCGALVALWWLLNL